MPFLCFLEYFKYFRSSLFSEVLNHLRLFVVIHGSIRVMIYSTIPISNIFYSF